MLTRFVHVVSQVFFCNINNQETGESTFEWWQIKCFCQNWRNKFNCPSCGQKTPKVRQSRKEIVVELKTPQFPFEILTFNMSKPRFCKVSSTLAENNKCWKNKHNFFLSRVTLQPEKKIWLNRISVCTVVRWTNECNPLCQGLLLKKSYGAIMEIGTKSNVSSQQLVNAKCS